MKRDAEEASLSDSEALKTKVKMSDSDKDEGAETASKEMDEQQAFTNVTKAKTPEHEETVAVSPTLSEEGEVADLKPDENMAIDQDEGKSHPNRRVCKTSKDLMKNRGRR